MNKAQSRNEQSRAVRAVLHRRANEKIDSDVFNGLKDVESRKAELIAQQLAINSRIGLLNAHIQRADAVVKQGGGQTPAKTYGGWKIERAKLVIEMQDVQAEILSLGVYSKAAREERLLGFNSVFVDLAREMLAADIFSRIQLATIHRLAERDAAARVSA